MKYLCVCATSYASECVFSCSGKIVTPLRASMNPQKVDMLTFFVKELVSTVTVLCILCLLLYIQHLKKFFKFSRYLVIFWENLLRYYIAIYCPALTTRHHTIMRHVYWPPKRKREVFDAVHNLSHPLDKHNQETRRHEIRLEWQAKEALGHGISCQSPDTHPKLHYKRLLSHNAASITSTWT